MFISLYVVAVYSVQHRTSCHIDYTDITARILSVARDGIVMYTVEHYRT